MKDAEDRSVAVLIQQALTPSVRLELLPKSVIDIFVTVIENDGTEGCVAAASLAASTALADAGIEMLGLVTSCSSVRLNSFSSRNSYSSLFFCRRWSARMFGLIQQSKKQRWRRVTWCSHAFQRWVLSLVFGKLGGCCQLRPHRYVYLSLPGPRRHCLTDLFLSAWNGVRSVARTYTRSLYKVS